MAKAGAFLSVASALLMAGCAVTPRYSVEGETRGTPAGPATIFGAMRNDNSMDICQGDRSWGRFTQMGVDTTWVTNAAGDMAYKSEGYPNVTNAVVVRAFESSSAEATMVWPTYERTFDAEQGRPLVDAARALATGCDALVRVAKEIKMSEGDRLQNPSRDFKQMFTVGQRPNPRIDQLLKLIN